MMRHVVLLAVMALLATLSLAKYSPSRSDNIAFCIQNDHAQMMCTNHCAKGKTCTATCGGMKWQVKVNPTTAKANFVSSSHPHAHVRQDQWPCSHWVIENHVSKKEMCPTTVDGTPNKSCMDVQTGVVRKAGYVGTI